MKSDSKIHLDLSGNSVSRSALPSKQSGAVLIVGLIILFLLTLVGTSGMTSVTLEERMVSNMQNATKAFQGAEAILSECEDQVRREGLDVLQVGAGLTQDYGENAANWGGPDAWWASSSFWSANGIISQETDLLQSATYLDGLIEAPRCVIEYVGAVSSSLGADELYAGAGQKIASRYVYRVVSASYGVDQSTSAVIESLFVKR